MSKAIVDRKDPRVKRFEGQRFNRLVAVEFLRMRRITPNSREQEWKFLCDCGKLRVALLRNVIEGKTGSCGCLKKTHGCTGKNIYYSWNSMMQRCLNENGRQFRDYGGRGITVCEEWRDFLGFVADMGNTHKKGLTLERKDNEKGYSKENCRWATKAEQNLNRRDSRLITFAGITQNLCVWARKLKVSSGTLQYRLKHWSLQKALTT